MASRSARLSHTPTCPPRAPHRAPHRPPWPRPPLAALSSTRPPGSSSPSAPSGGAPASFASPSRARGWGTAGRRAPPTGVWCTSTAPARRACQTDPSPSSGAPPCAAVRGGRPSPPACPPSAWCPPPPLPRRRRHRGLAPPTFTALTRPCGGCSAAWPPAGGTPPPQPSPCPRRWPANVATVAPGGQAAGACGRPCRRRRRCSSPPPCTVYPPPSALGWKSPSCKPPSTWSWSGRGGPPPPSPGKRQTRLPPAPPRRRQTRRRQPPRPSSPRPTRRRKRGRRPKQRPSWPRRRVPRRVPRGRRPFTPPSAPPYHPPAWRRDRRVTRPSWPTRRRAGHRRRCPRGGASSGGRTAPRPGPRLTRAPPPRAPPPPPPTGGRAAASRATGRRRRGPMRCAPPRGRRGGRRERRRRARRRWGERRRWGGALVGGVVVTGAIVEDRMAAASRGVGGGEGGRWRPCLTASGHLGLLQHWGFGRGGASGDGCGPRRERLLDRRVHSVRTRDLPPVSRLSCAAIDGIRCRDAPWHPCALSNGESGADVSGPAAAADMDMDRRSAAVGLWEGGEVSVSSPGLGLLAIFYLSRKKRNCEAKKPNVYANAHNWRVRRRLPITLQSPGDRPQASFPAHHPRALHHTRDRQQVVALTGCCQACPAGRCVRVAGRRSHAAPWHALEWQPHDGGDSGRGLLPPARAPCTSC